MAEPILEIDESDIDEYEEVQKALDAYHKECAKLLEMTARRAEMLGLLKIAQPSKIRDIREVISEIDKTIEMTEEIIEASLEIVEARRRLVRDAKRTEAMMQMMLPELRKHLAETDPEKLEQLDAMLDPNSDKVH